MTSVGSIISGAFRLVTERPGAVAVWILVYLVINVVSLFAMRPMLEMQAAAIGGGDPKLIMADFWSTSGWFFLIQFVAMLVFLILFAATQRAVLRPQEEGLGFLRFGMDELRIIGLFLLLVLLFYGGMFLVILLFGAVFGVAVFAGMGAGGGAGAGGAAAGAALLMVLAFFLLFGVFIWLWVRLSLAFPMTFLRRRIALGEAWRLTRGYFWTLFGAYIVLAILVMVLSGIVSTFGSASYLSEIMSKGFTPEAMVEAAQNQLRRMSELNVMTLLGLALNAAVSGLSLALFGGAVATAARELAGDETLAREFA